MSAITRDEAENVLCVQTLGATVIAGEANFHPTACSGPECMGWRWFDTLKEDGTACHHTPSAMFPRNPEPKDRPLSERRGYCGLAGKP